MLAFGCIENIGLVFAGDGAGAAPEPDRIKMTRLRSKKELKSLC
jgi:hypothetical protein